MCDAGGPRCPVHAGAELAKARDLLQRIVDRRQAGEVSSDDINQAEAALDKAQGQWDSTHPGMDELAALLETPGLDPAQRAIAVRRLEAGFAKRLAEYTARASREGNERDYMLIDNAVAGQPKLPVKEIHVSDDPRVPISYEAHAPAFARRYYAGLKSAKAQEQTGAQVDLLAQKDISGMRLFTTRDGQSGVAMTTDGYITGVFTTSPRYKRTAIANLRHAVRHGANRLDCFDTYLPTIYRAASFTTVARLPFADDYAPDGWDYDAYRRWNNGRPDIVFMVHRRYMPEARTRSCSDYDEGYGYARDLTRKEDHHD